jgi:hypothetical protein
MTELQRMGSECSLLISEVKASRAIGSIFFTIFGTAWLILWYFSYGVTRGVLLAILAGGICLLLLSSFRFKRYRAAYRAGSHTPQNKSQSWVFVIVNVAQWFIIVTGATILARMNQSDWIVPLIIFTVGAHFIPLAFAFRSRAIHVIGIALMLAAIIYPHLTNAGPANPLGALCAGLILWAGAIASLLHTGSGPEAAKIP